VPLRDEAGERERQGDMRIKSTTEECEEEPTEPSQYYEYGEDTSRREEQHIFFFFSFLFRIDILRFRIFGNKNLVKQLNRNCALAKFIAGFM